MKTGYYALVLLELFFYIICYQPRHTNKEEETEYYKAKANGKKKKSVQQIEVQHDNKKKSNRCKMTSELLHVNAKYIKKKGGVQVSAVRSHASGTQ